MSITNAIGGVGPTVAAVGNDADVNLNLSPQGAGHVEIAGTGAFGLPSGTALQAPTGFTGGIRFNITSNYIDYWNGSAWVDLTSGSLLSTLTYITKLDNTVDLPNSQPLSLLATGIAYVTTATGVVGTRTLTGTTNRIAVTNGTGAAGNPTVDIDAAYVGQTSITTLGTVSTGVWAATAVAETHGGTNQTSYILGDTLYASGANTLAKLSGNTANTIKYLAQTGTGVVSAAPAWTTISGGDITGAALTEVNDTNITLSLGGAPATALLRATSITAGWTGTLAYSRGGLGAAITADNGAIFYSTASNAALLASTPTAGKVLQSGSSAAPSWSTPTYPSASGTAGKILRSDGTNNIYTTSTFADTYSASDLLYSNGANVVTGLATTNSASLSTNATGVPTWLALTDGQIVVGSSTGAPAAATITAGSGITVTNGHNSISIAATAVASAFDRVAIQVITSTGTYTPTAGMQYVIIEALGGGGAGGGNSATAAGNYAAGGGGGAGEYVMGIFSAATIGVSQSVTIGAGGAGASGAGGGNGGATSVGALLTANGGIGGGLGSTGTGGQGLQGTGGTGSVTGSVIVQGNPGISSAFVYPNFLISGAGANSQYGPGALPITGAAGAGNNAPTEGHGAGGSGSAQLASGAAQAGGNGSAGVAIFTEFLSV